MSPLALLTSDTLARLLVSDVLKVTVALVLIYLWLGGGKPVWAALRYWLCALVLLGRVAIPAPSLAVPAWSIPILPGPSSVNLGSNPKTAASPLPLPVAEKVKRDALATGEAASSAPRPGPKNPKNESAAGVIKPSVSASREPIPFSVEITWLGGILLIWAVGALLTVGSGFRQTAQISRIARRGIVVDDRDWAAMRDEIARTLHLR